MLRDASCSPFCGAPVLIRLLRRFLGRYRLWLTLVVVFQAVQAIASLYLPSLNADIIDNGVVKGDTGYIWRHGGWMLLVSAVQVLFSVVAIRYGSLAAMGFGRDVRSSLFRRVNEFSSKEVADFGAPSLITRVTNDVQQVQTLVYMTCTMLVAAPITAIGGLFMALREDVKLTIILGVAIPALLVSIGNVIARMVPTFRRMQDEIDGMNRVLREQITGIRVVRAFVRERFEEERFAVDNDRLARTALRGGRLMALMMPTVTFIVNVSSTAVIWFGGRRVADGDLQVGALIAFLTYLTQILMAVMLATYMAALVPRASVSSERINAVLDTPSSIASVASPTAPAEGSRPSLELDGVGFRYPGAEHSVLDGVTVRCDAGTVLAVIGSTGSGKTTLVNLVARLIDATTGSVRVNGIDVRQLDTDVLWQRIGLVPQRPYLFAGTVASNLRYGRPTATDDEMWEALEIAQAADFVRAMGGLDAAIAQGGSNVSGGQRQRLAIARAVVRRPDVYVFDDSFSALDMATDARLRAALAPRITDPERPAVLLVVAQRVTSIRSADQILVLDDGEPVGLGTHEELLRDCETYREIVNSQLTADETELTTSGGGA
jgi:ATP-binding cassette subfamily B protein